MSLAVVRRRGALAVFAVRSSSTNRTVQGDIHENRFRGRYDPSAESSGSLFGPEDENNTAHGSWNDREEVKVRLSQNDRNGESPFFQLHVDLIQSVLRTWGPSPACRQKT